MKRDRIDLQNAEFDALTVLSKAWTRLSMTPVVDDDYEEMRHYYESALRDFLDKVNENRKTVTLTAPSVRVSGSKVPIQPYQSIPHISVISFARAMRWHPEGLESWSESDWAVALAGEVGELCNIVKKINRDKHGLRQHAVDPRKLAELLAMEIGDVYIYLDLFARRVGLNLEECIRDTFNRISEREGFPERL